MPQTLIKHCFAILLFVSSSAWSFNPTKGVDDLQSSYDSTIVVGRLQLTSRFESLRASINWLGWIAARPVRVSATGLGGCEAFNDVALQVTA